MANRTFKRKSTKNQLGGKKGKGKRKTNGKKPANPWITHVKKFAKEQGINYREALKHPGVKSSYKKIE